MLFAIFIILIAIQRLVELYIAKQNEKQLKGAGAVEYGKSHYRWMVIMHLSFLLFSLLKCSLMKGMWLDFGRFG